MPAVIINKKLEVHTAEHLLAVAPKEATELILATYEEATSRGITITRRIALGWKVAGMAWLPQLQNAANGFFETASLSDTGAVREDSNGAPVSIKGGDRRHGWWTVQFLPLPMIRCWARFESALPEIAPEPEKVLCKATPPTPPVEIPPKIVPVTVTTPEQPRLIPLSGLRFCRKSGFLGNCAAPSSDYLTDGRVLLVKAACDEKTASLETVAVGGYGPNNPAPDASMKKLMASALEDAKAVSEIVGYALGKDINESDHADNPYACVRAGENIVVADAHKVRFIQTATGADTVKIAEGNKPILFLKSGSPVALLSPLNSPDAVAGFRCILANEAAKVPTLPLHCFEFCI